VDDLEVGNLADERHHLLSIEPGRIPRKGHGAAGYLPVRPAGKASGEQAVQRTAVLDAIGQIGDDQMRPPETREQLARASGIAKGQHAAAHVVPADLKQPTPRTELAQAFLL